MSEMLVEQWDDVCEALWLAGKMEKPSWVCHMDGTAPKFARRRPWWKRLFARVKLT